MSVSCQPQDGGDFHVTFVHDVPLSYWPAMFRTCFPPNFASLQKEVYSLISMPFAPRRQSANLPTMDFSDDDDSEEELDTDFRNPLVRNSTPLPLMPIINSVKKPKAKKRAASLPTATTASAAAAGKVAKKSATGKKAAKPKKRLTKITVIPDPDISTPGQDEGKRSGKVSGWLDRLLQLKQEKGETGAGHQVTSTPIVSKSAAAASTAADTPAPTASSAAAAAATPTAPAAGVPPVTPATDPVEKKRRGRPPKKPLSITVSPEVNTSQDQSAAGKQGEQKISLALRRSPRIAQRR